MLRITRQDLELVIGEKIPHSFKFILLFNQLIMKQKSNTDLPDSVKDKKHLKTENFELDLPDTKDIPGQEEITVPPLGELADTTISSDDEEGVGLLDDMDEENEIADQLNANVTKDERKLLDDAAKKINSSDQDALERAKPDQYDEDGEPLNEKTTLSGSDLDIPGSELDDDNEEIGEEDEENNSYSLNDEDEDDNNTRQ
jgi:hypothetical protein